MTEETIAMDQYSVLFNDMDQHYACLLGTMPGVVYTLDEKGHFTYISSTAQESLGFSRNDLLGRHFSYVVHPGDLATVSRDHMLPRFSGIPTGNDRAPKLFDERRSFPRKTSALQVRLCSKGHAEAKNDGVVVCKVNASGQYDRKNHFCGTVGVISDITAENDTSFTFETKQKYNALELLTQALSHVFSNVFTGIYGNLQLIEMQLGNNEEFTGNIEAIKHSVEGAATLIRKLSKTVAEPESHDNHTLTQMVLDAGSDLFGVAGLTYDCSEASQPLWRIESDPDYIRHVLRAVCYHVVQTAEQGSTVKIVTANLDTVSYTSLRLDCSYLRVTIEFSPSGGEKIDMHAERSDSLERIAVMALSYTLLKKIGGQVRISRSGDNSLVELFLPALEEQLQPN